MRRRREGRPPGSVRALTRLPSPGVARLRRVEHLHGLRVVQLCAAAFSMLQTQMK